MLDFERTIELDCKGENTGHRYTGTFIVKLFLSHAEKLSLTRDIRSKLGDTEAVVASWNLKSFMGHIEKITSEPNVENVCLNDETKNFIYSLLFSFLPDVPKPSTLLSNIIVLNAHIVKAPDWWKESGNGSNLYDEEPVSKLYEDLHELVKGFVKDEELK